MNRLESLKLKLSTRTGTNDFYKNYKEHINNFTDNNIFLSLLITFLTSIGMLFTLSDLFVYHSLYSLLISFFVIFLFCLNFLTSIVFTFLPEPRSEYINNYMYPFYRLLIASFMIFLLSYKFYKIYIFQECALKKIECDSRVEVEKHALLNGLITSLLTLGMYIFFVYILPYLNNKLIHLTRNIKPIRFILTFFNIFSYISSINDYFNIGFVFSLFAFISHIIVVMLIRRKLK